MPIDLTSVARSFEIQRRILVPIFDRLGDWLDDRLRHARRLDQQSRGFPILRYRDEALAMYVADHQKSAVLAPPSFAESVRSAGHAFVGGVSYVKTALDDSLGLLDLLRALNAAVGEIHASVDQFAVPQPAMFNPGERHASDLFGLAALGVRVAFGDRNQIVDPKHIGEDNQIVEAARGAVALTNGVATVRGSGTPAGDPNVDASIGDILDEVTRGLLGGILLVPAVVDLLEITLVAADRVIRRELLKTCDAVIRGVYELRRQVFELFFAELPALLDWLERDLIAGGFLITLSLRFVVEFARLYLDELIASLIDFSGQLKRVIDFWVESIVRLLDITDTLGNVNLVPVFMTLFAGIPGWLISGTLPPYTIADLIRDGSEALRSRLIDLITAARVALAARQFAPPLWSDGDARVGDLDHQLELIQKIVSEALRPGPVMGDEVLDKSRVADLEDVGKTVIDPALAKLGPKLAGARNTLVTQIGQIFTAGSDTLVQLQTAFDAASADAVHLGYPAELTAIARLADQHTEAAFGPPLDGPHARPAADPIAASLERWLTGSGFDAIGRAIPTYLAELDRAWRERKGTPREASALLTDKLLTETTSPHLLAKRPVRLARVQLKEMRFQVTAPQVDEALAERIADELGVHVARAYAKGRERLAEMHRIVHRRFDEEQARQSGKAPGKPRAPAPPVGTPTRTPAGPPARSP